ncbi:hypothetical protein B0H13DRAFT_1897592 [Mycena leptocephala]|nr:hypothetical protein B0H13DRAFT_1897592 [Mycena leptocephala]
MTLFTMFSPISAQSSVFECGSMILLTFLVHRISRTRVARITGTSGLPRQIFAIFSSSPWLARSPGLDVVRPFGTGFTNNLTLLHNPCFPYRSLLSAAPRSTTLTRANARSSTRRGKLAVDRATNPLFSTCGFRARRQLRDWDGAGGVVEMMQAREVAHTYARQLASRYSTCVFRAQRHQLGTGVALAMTMTRYHRPAGSTPFTTHASAFPPILHPSPSQASPTVSPRRTATYITSAATHVHPLLWHTAFTECKEALEIEVQNDALQHESHWN